jgi:hypothetical protein
MRMCGRHAPAFLGAATAGFGAPLAVLSVMPRAFIAALLAHLGADFAYGARELAAAPHIGGGKAADLGAVQIERNALCHFLDVRFLEAGCSAVVASDGTVVAGFNAGLELSVWHGGLQNVSHALDASINRSRLEYLP